MRPKWTTYCVQPRRTNGRSEVPLLAVCLQRWLSLIIMSWVFLHYLRSESWAVCWAGEKKQKKNAPDYFVAKRYFWLKKKVSSFPSEFECMARVSDPCFWHLSLWGTLVTDRRPCFLPQQIYIELQIGYAHSVLSHSPLLQSLKPSNYAGDLYKRRHYIRPAPARWN